MNKEMTRLAQYLVPIASTIGNMAMDEEITLRERLRALEMLRGVLADYEEKLNEKTQKGGKE